jgi:hypothetical protein
MNTAATEPTVSIIDIDAQMQARERAAYEREVDASIAAGLAQARDASSRKYSLSDMHAQVSQTIERVAKRVAHA